MNAVPGARVCVCERERERPCALAGRVERLGSKRVDAQMHNITIACWNLKSGAWIGVRSALEMAR